MSQTTCIRNGVWITLIEDQPVIKGYLIMKDDRIVEIAAGEPIDQSAYDVVLDGKGKLFMPGLVNTHGHAAMSLLRGYADDLNLQVWLEQKMWPMEGKFTADDVRWGTALSVLEMVKGGTTSFVDMYDHMGVVAEVVESAGLRGCLTRGVIGHVPADIQQIKLDDAIGFARDWHNKADGRITTMMSPHAPYTNPPDYIERIIQAAHELNLPMHTHMSETRYEVDQHAVQYGIRPVEHMEQLGMFSRPAIIAHGVHLNDQEIEILRRNQVRVSHNPGSNLKLASGIARVPELLRAGVLVSLGTDSAASNNNLDMFEEMRLAALIHKGVSGDPTAVPAIEALRMGTVYGAQSIWLNDVGTLAAGNKADFIAIDSDQPHFQPKTDLISHIIYSASARDVTDVWVDGKQLVKASECVTMDQERIIYEANRHFDRLNGA